MDKTTKNALERIKEHVTGQVGSMNRKQKEELYESLQDWAYRQYSKVYIDGLDEDSEDQYYVEA